MKWLPIATAGLLASQAFGTESTQSSLPLRLETRSPLNSRLANVHVDYDGPAEDLINFTYGPCNSKSEHNADHIVVRNSHGKPHRLVWIIPKDVSSGGCVSGWSESGKLLGRSSEQYFHHGALQRDIGKRDASKQPRIKRGQHSIPMNNETGIDVWGPWFDGVAALEDKNLSAVDEETAKSREIAIVGGGMAGLMTYLILHQAGLTNVTILEASQRLGGRIRTEYLTGGPFDYSYQEMGAMRIPESTVFSNVTYNITDHHLVFKLAEEMNKINNHNKALNVDFVPFIQNSPNGLMYFNGLKLGTGLPPTQAEVAENSTLDASTPLPSSAQELSDLV